MNTDNVFPITARGKHNDSAEVVYEVRRDGSNGVESISSIEDDIARAIEALTRNHLGVRGEVRTVAGSPGAIVLTISGGFDADHLDQIWQHHLAMFGLVGVRGHSYSLAALQQ